jgi:DNA-binding CsgD family transcriptional regulator
MATGAMGSRPTVERALREIVRLCHAGLDGPTLTQKVFGSLRPALGIDAFFCATADPATVLFTSATREEIPHGSTPRFLTNEFLQDDVNKFAALAHGPQPVDSLYAATRGEPDQSARFRDILVPMGFGDELRAALTVDGACWGVMCLHRELSAPGFSPAEIDLLRRVRPHLAEGLRTALLLAEPRPLLGDESPGLVLLSDELALIAATPAAQRWLEELANPGRAAELPDAVLAVAARLRALDAGEETEASSLPRVRVRTASGRWLVLHASRLAGPGAAGQVEGQIAVIVEVAGPIEVAPLILAAYDLTPRERTIASLVLAGRSTEQVADELCISPLTVQQHLKAVFDKVGVRSRRELVAQIFARHYAPRMLAGGRLGPDGWFAPGPG